MTAVDQQRGTRRARPWSSGMPPSTVRGSAAGSRTRFARHRSPAPPCPPGCERRGRPAGCRLRMASTARRHQARSRRRPTPARRKRSHGLDALADQADRARVALGHQAAALPERAARPRAWSRPRATVGRRSRGSRAGSRARPEAPGGSSRRARPSDAAPAAPAPRRSATWRAGRRAAADVRGAWTRRLRTPSGRSERPAPREARTLRRCAPDPGRCPPWTSAAYARAASSRTPCTSAYCLTKRAILPVRRPKASCQTRTWPSQPVPAPMPMVGIVSVRGDLAGHVAGDHLHDDGEGAGLLDRPRVGEHPLGGVAPALDPVAAEGVLALRGEADVGHHRDAARGSACSITGTISTPPSSLTQCAPRLLHEADRGQVALLGGGLVGAEREVADHQRALAPTGRPRGSAGAARRR